MSERQRMDTQEMVLIHNGFKNDVNTLSSFVWIDIKHRSLKAAIVFLEGKLCYVHHHVFSQ